MFLFILSLNQRTPLHKAARRAHVGIVKYLVYKAANIGVKDINGVLTVD